MAKSINSKIKRKHSAKRAEKYRPKALERLRAAGTLADPTLKKAYAQGFVAAAQEVESRRCNVEMSEANPAENSTGGATLTENSLATIARMRQSKRTAGTLDPTDVATANQEVTQGELSKTQLNKLCKASRLKRYSHKRNARRNIQTYNNKRRTDKR